MAQGDATSVRSGSTSRSSSAQAFLDLQEMFLLVDVDTELQDVQQVELNFKRHSLTICIERFFSRSRSSPQVKTE